MKLRFFYLTDDKTLERTTQARVVEAWLRKKPWDDSTGSRYLSLVTVTLDDDLNPRRIYMLAVIVKDGWITEDSRLKVLATVQNQQPAFAPPLDYSAKHPTVVGLKWADWDKMAKQLTVALDITRSEVEKVGSFYGGPLPIATLARISLAQLCREWVVA